MSHLVRFFLRWGVVVRSLFGVDELTRLLLLAPGVALFLDILPSFASIGVSVIDGSAAGAKAGLV